MKNKKHYFPPIIEDVLFGENDVMYVSVLENIGDWDNISGVR